MAPKELTLKESLKKLEAILAWFERQETVDIEEGLAQAKEGSKLLKFCKEKLKKAENEFHAVKKELEKES